MSTVPVWDEGGSPLSNCSLARAMVLLDKGSAEVICSDPMTIKLKRPTGNGVPPSSPRSRDGTNPSQKKRASRLKSLRVRDGNDCFYCGLELGTEDITLEHLLSEKDGGSKRPANLALAHKKCNELAADLPVVEKVALRDRLRAENNGMPRRPAIC